VSKKKSWDLTILKAAKLDREIKALTSELEEVKGQLKEAFSTNVGKFQVEGQVEMLVTRRRELDKAKALEQYGKKVTVRVVTPESVKAALSPAEVEALYVPGSLALTFRSLA